jgi:hypothetical protein
MHSTTIKIIDAQQAKLQKYQAKVTKDKCADLVQQNLQNQTFKAQLHQHQN